MASPSALHQSASADYLRGKVDGGVVGAVSGLQALAFPRCSRAGQWKEDGGV